MAGSFKKKLNPVEADVKNKKKKKKIDTGTVWSLIGHVMCM